MTEDWERILEGVLRPARARLDECLRAHRAYAAAMADRSHGRARALAEIEAGLNALRARIFQEGSGVVPAQMTTLEREWLAAARVPLRDLETLWKQIAPARWLGTRAAPDSAEAMVALASDADGVESAERAAASMREVLAPWGVTVGARVDWIVSAEIAFAARAEELFAPAIAALSDASHATSQRAHRLRRDVRARLGTPSVTTRNSSLARELGWLAFASIVWAERRTDPAPFAPALEIYRLGYVPTAVDASGVTLTALAVSSDSRERA